MKTEHSFFRWILVFLVAVQAISGLAGGYGLVASPSGGLFEGNDVYRGEPMFSSFLIPGLILLLVLGVFPVLVLIGLIHRPEWKWISWLNVYPDRHWSWTFSIYLGLMMVV